MSNNSETRTGVFLCRCGKEIEGPVDLSVLQDRLSGNPLIAHVQTLPFSCEKPGLASIRKSVKDNKLNRVIVAGCESRILLKKFEKELAELGLEQGQVDIVNLRDHVARANEGTPEELAAKGAKLIGASAAALDTLIPTPRVPVDFNGPVMIVGGGIATYSAAHELISRGIETIIAINTDQAEDEIRMLHEHYPGERQHHERLTAIMEEVLGSPLVRKITVGEIEKVTGRVGNYQVAFSSYDGKPPLIHQCGAIIAALDGQMLNQGSDFGHDGKRVVCHTEMEEYIWMHGAPKGDVVFWINDLETPGRPWANLSALSAWKIACEIRERQHNIKIHILYNDQMKVPLSAAERKHAREAGITWVPYDHRIRPTVQSGFISFNNGTDNIEQEIGWDMLCLSPLRSPGHESLRIAEILGFDVHENEFLERNPQMVRPEMVGQDEKFLAGSARRPCDLRETLRQGRRAAVQAAELVEKARAGELFAPRMVCTVDTTKCIGCGLCNEICDCGGIEPFEGKGGNIPRAVDPMVCTGGGTCAAACPYHAITLQNNTTAMREARIIQLARSLAENEILAFGCNWGGGAAADNAGLKGLKHNSRFYMAPVSCIGQIDPCILGRALLEGANGLLLMGCPPEECHHSYGLDHTWSRVNLIRKLMSLCGLERQRISLSHTDMNQPEMFVRTIENFVNQIDKLGPINRDEATMERLQALYDTLNNARVRWVLGAGLRRPNETHYPTDQRNALAYDETLSDVLSEEFIKVRVANLLTKAREHLNLKEISNYLNVDPEPVLGSLQELAGEGMISTIYKDRTPYYLKS